MPSSHGPHSQDQLKSVRGFAIQNLKMVPPNTPAYELMRIFELMVANKSKPEVMKKLAQVPHVEEVIALIEKDGPEAAIVDFWLAYVDGIELMDFIRLLREKLVVLLREEIQAVLTPTSPTTTEDSTVALTDSDLEEEISIPPSAPVPDASVSTDRPPTRVGRVERPEPPKAVVKPDEQHLAVPITGLSHAVAMAAVEDADRAAKRAAEEARKPAEPKRPAAAPRPGTSFFPDAGTKGTDPGVRKRERGTSARRRAAAAPTTPDSSSKPTLANPVDSRRPTAIGEDSGSNHETLLGPDSDIPPPPETANIHPLKKPEAMLLRKFLKVLYENQDSILVQSLIDFYPLAGVLIRDMNEQTGEKSAGIAIEKYAVSNIDNFVDSVLRGIRDILQTSTVTELRLMIKKADLILEEQKDAPNLTSQTSLPTRRADTAVRELCLKIKAEIAAEGIDISDEPPRESRASLMPAAPSGVTPTPAPAPIKPPVDDETSFGDLNEDEPSGAKSIPPASAPLDNSDDTEFRQVADDETSFADIDSEETSANEAEIVSDESSESSETGEGLDDLENIQVIWSEGPERVDTLPDRIPAGSWLEGVLKPDSSNHGKVVVEKAAGLTLDVVHPGSEITLEGLNSRLIIKQASDKTAAQSITIYHPEGYDLTNEKNFSLPVWIHPYNIRVKKA